MSKVAYTKSTDFRLFGKIILWRKVEKYIEAQRDTDSVEDDLFLGKSTYEFKKDDE